MLAMILAALALFGYPIGGVIYGHYWLKKHPEERKHARELTSGSDSWGPL